MISWQYYSPIFIKLTDFIILLIYNKVLEFAEDTYHPYRKRFEKRCERAGIHHRHGLRHAYAQRRYCEITGFNCPAIGGPPHHALTTEQRQIDRTARLQVSHELGHSRAAITSQYLGR